MRPSSALVFGVLTSAALIASPAHALSDLVPFTPAGWSSPVPVRATGDATSTSAADSPVLTGEVPSFMSRAVRNSGTTAVLVAPTNQILVDGVVRHAAVSALLAPGTTTFVNNVAITVRGGLHSVGALADATNAEAESNELNNEFGRQLSFTPADLALGTIVTRSAPPLKRAGTSAIVGTVYDNQDGLRLPANSVGWEAVALRPPVTQDYDLSLYAASTSPSTGFRTPLKSSTLGTGATDFILNYGFLPSSPAHDIGITNFSGAALDYSVEHRQSDVAFLSSGNTYPGLTLATNQMLAVHLFKHIPNAAVPRILIELTGTPGQGLHLALFDPSLAVASRSDAIADVVMDATGRAFIDRALELGGPAREYGLVVYRDQTDGGTAAGTYTLRIRPTPADLSNQQVVGSTAPVNASNAGFNVTTLPTALDGEVHNTTMSAYYSNIGAIPTGPIPVSAQLDGVEFIQGSLPSLAPGTAGTFALGPLTVRGGRHTLAYVLDAANGIDETREDNNSFGRQFVWSPLQLLDGVPVTRDAPPDQIGGVGTVPLATPFYPNCDGFRLPTAPGPQIRMIAAAALGTGLSDINLNAFARSSGPLDGFATPLAGTANLSRETSMLAFTRFGTLPDNDFSATSVVGLNETYVVEAVASELNQPEIGALDPTTIASGHLLKAFTIHPGVAPPFRVMLENISGDADLGMSIFHYALPGEDVHQMFDTVPGGHANDNGVGASEVCTVTEAGPFGYYGVVVYKVGTFDLITDATFRIRVIPISADVTPPAPRVTSFALASGNPLRTSTRIRYALATDGAVSIDVLDLQGRQVRTLVHGKGEVGEHSTEWDGTDASGARVANGAYFVRFTTIGFQRVLKLAVLR